MNIAKLLRIYHGAIRTLKYLEFWNRLNSSLHSTRWAVNIHVAACFWTKFSAHSLNCRWNCSSHPCHTVDCWSASRCVGCSHGCWYVSAQFRCVEWRWFGWFYGHCSLVLSCGLSHFITHLLSRRVLATCIPHPAALYAWQCCCALSTIYDTCHAIRYMLLLLTQQWAMFFMYRATSCNTIWTVAMPRAGLKKYPVFD